MLRIEDVERAFDHFLEHYSQGRPFVLAAHSQGSVHLRTLLEKRITGTALRERLVAAYPVGFGIDRESDRESRARRPGLHLRRATGLRGDLERRRSAREPLRRSRAATSA